MAKTLPGSRGRAPERTPLSWIPTFLADLEANGVVRAAARGAGIASGTVYSTRRVRPDFASAWDRALGNARGAREAAGARRAARSAEGVAEAPADPQERTSRYWRKHFFEALAETSCVRTAAARARVAPQSVYRLRREEPEFAGQWRAALLEGYDNLEMELLGFLRDPRPGRRMDVTAALRLLAAHRETVARERALREDDDEQAVFDSIDAFLETMRQRRLANSAILLECPAAHEPDGAETGDDAD